MQLAGGCASGTLYTVGGGSTKMVFTLAFFMLGSLIGAAHLPWWLAAPSFGSISLLDAWGLWPALLAQLAVFATIAGATLVLRSEEHTSELQSLMRTSYAVFCLKKKTHKDK